jgi:hypothetical protein
LFDVMGTLLIEGLNAIGIVHSSWEVLRSHFLLWILLKKKK